jgi:hypothetical protein
MKEVGSKDVKGDEEKHEGKIREKKQSVRKYCTYFLVYY